MLPALSPQAGRQLNAPRDGLCLLRDGSHRLVLALEPCCHLQPLFSSILHFHVPGKVGSLFFVAFV